MLELAVGSTAVSLAILLAAFMGGTCFGSLLLPRVVAPRFHPLRAYALIELGIGACGILALLWMPVVGGYGRGMAAAACLIPPTVLMGATLPALARAARGVSWLGFLYGVNIAGAVAGCLLAGFYLLREFDVATATYVAMGINLAMAAMAGVGASGSAPSQSRFFGNQPAALASGTAVYFAIALSGFCALAAEAIWTRLLGLLFGASVYAFAVILAVFLAGLGMGSGMGAALAKRVNRPGIALGWCQLLAAAAIAWTAFNLDASLPYWPVNPAISSNIWFNFQLDVVRAVWALLPATLLWGASFPLALAAAASKEQDPAQLMAGVYAANTFGAIVGALGASLLLIAWVGSQRAQQILVASSMVAGLLLLRSWKFAAAVVPAGLLIYSVPPVAKPLIAYGRYAATWVGKSDIVYAREGLNSAVAVASFANGAVTFHVAGKIQASNVPRDMRLQRMLGHLTTLPNAHPSSVLVIGCGAGITAGAVSIDPRVERETIVEIERLVPEVAARYFREPNFDVLDNPKVRVRIDDGRHYLMASSERFDGITIDPLDPWVKGAANLYTEEFLEAMKQHLNPGGVVTMYIQLFETDLEAVKSSVATFFAVFPNGTIWGNPYNGQGHDMVLMGQVEPLRIDLDEMEQRVGYRGGDSRIAQSLAEIGMNSPVDLFATYASRRPDLAEWLRNAPINRDRNLRMQYLAGLGLNLDDAAAIYAGMLRLRRFPEDLFASAEGRVESLRRAMGAER
ncbi:MAG TPA: fused MFS/spermidine synthase [Bryobacteraceae bacterium]|nr:fused MFS/spermidine synthase [Bryobacteraceae bacterium]